MGKGDDGPKRPPSAYFIFTKEKREDLVKKYPNLKVTEIAKKLGEQWKNLSDKGSNLTTMSTRGLRLSTTRKPAEPRHQRQALARIRGGRARRVQTRIPIK
jgi:hypothetical protein